MSAARSERFEFPVDDRRSLRGVVCWPDAPVVPPPWVAVAHGYSSHCNWGFYPELAQRLAQRGIASIRFNFSGGGLGADLESLVDPDLFGHNTYVDELADLERIASFASSARLDRDRGAILGHSRGGGMAIVHAAESGVYRAVVAWAAMDAILRFSEERRQLWMSQGYIDVYHFGVRRRVPLDRSVLDSAEENRERLNILAACGRLDAPLLAVHGDRDRSLDVGCAERLVAAASDSELLVVPGADHVFGARQPLPDPMPTELELVLSSTVDWLAARLSAFR